MEVNLILGLPGILMYLRRSSCIIRVAIKKRHLETGEGGYILSRDMRLVCRLFGKFLDPARTHLKHLSILNVSAGVSGEYLSGSTDVRKDVPQMGRGPDGRV